ncbi:putative ribonuclease H-like domain-containing protein [Tanacetum coccineum]
MTTARTRSVVNTSKGRMDTDLKKSRWVWRPKGNYLDHVSKDSGSFMLKKGNREILLQDHAMVDSGCSSHMTGNKAYLSDYEDYNGGFMAFGSDPKGGKITGKGKIRTANLDFDDVYFVNELKFNLFSVLQICNKKNSVLFTETKCLILSPSFKLLDESQVVLRAPRKDDVYSLDLKNIIPSGGLENQLNHNVKIIRCDNGTEFKNHVMNELCAKKGIKREFSVARTPQQNGVEKRKNRTLIEATRTMLADSLLPIPFWAEVVNTACYVLNRVLVTKPQNKTPYKLLIGKFDGKSDKGYLLGYSITSKAFRVYNKRTKRVEKSLHINFLEDQPNVVNVDAGTQDSYVTGSSRKDKESTQEYILLPLHPYRTRILVEDVAPAAHENPSESFPKDNNVQDSEDVADNEGQHQMTEDEQVLHDDLENMIAQESTSTNKLSIVRSSISTATTPYVSVASTPTDDSGAFSKEPKNISQALQDEIWVKAMQEELLQFKLQKVWILVDLPSGKKAIGTKWEEGIDYDEVFAPVAKIEAIRLFLAFASYMGFTVYQMDVKSAFLYGTIEEEVYVHQPPGFVDPAHPNKVYKVIKALYGLHQAPRAWYETLSSFLMENGFRRGTIDKTLFIKKKKSDIMLVQVYVDDIIFGSTKKSMCTEFEDCMHKRFQMSSMGELTFFLGLQSIRTTTTPIESNKPLVKDEYGEDVDVHVYKSMIGSLMYLTASRPDIMFAVCACARFQVTPKASHLNAVKRIFRYLKHQPKLGLWYLRDSPFELEAFSDSDYRGANLDRKSTTGGCQFLSRRLISWQCKK